MYYAVGIYRGTDIECTDEERIWFRNGSDIGGYWTNNPYDARVFTFALGAQGACNMLTEDYDTMVIDGWDMGRVKDGTLNLLAYSPAAVRDDDDVVRKYADILKDIYEARTAGEYTFEGVLSSMLRDIKSP